MTLQEFGIGVNIIQTITQKKFATEQIEVYYSLLKHLTVEQLKAGLERMFRARVYSNIPMPAEIIEYCEDKKDIESQALLQREELKNAIYKISMYDSVAFSDPVQHKIIEALGGWIKAHTKTREELDNFFKFEYVKMYKAYSTKGTGQIPLVLTGMHDALNNVADVKPKLVVGDSERYNRMCIEYSKRYNDRLESNIKRIGVD